MIIEKQKRLFISGETSCNIISDTESAIEAAISSIQHHKQQLKKFIQSNPQFLHSFSPIEVDDGPIVVRFMADAAEKAGVGPMAAVAGVLADLAVESMSCKGAKIAVVENGGEVSAISKKPINVTLLTGEAFPSKRIGFKLAHFPIGLATSSGVYSHAFSFGDAEAVTIFARNSGLADAAATSVCNIISGNNPEEIIKQGIEKALSIVGVEGVFILYKGHVGCAGKIPKILKILKDR